MIRDTHPNSGHRPADQYFINKHSSSGFRLKGQWIRYINFLKMELTISYQYYLKARSAYPYDLAETAEMLNYALSYDEECAPALCLMGQMQMEVLKDFEAAEDYFQKALLADPRFVDTYKYLSLLLIWVGKFRQAEQIINKSRQIKGMPAMMILERELTLSELKGDIRGALMAADKGILFAVNEHSLSYFEREKSRLNRKIFGSVRNEMHVLPTHEHDD